MEEEALRRQSLARQSRGGHQMKKPTRRSVFDLVPDEGLEPPRLTAPDPKSGVSANFTSRAQTYLILKAADYLLFSAISFL